MKLLEKATDQSLSPDMHPFSQQGATTSPESNRAFLASLSNQQVHCELHALYNDDIVTITMGDRLDYN